MAFAETDQVVAGNECFVAWALGLDKVGEKQASEQSRAA
jgi:hypothetical protein